MYHANDQQRRGHESGVNSEWCLGAGAPGQINGAKNKPSRIPCSLARAFIGYLYFQCGRTSNR